MKTYGRQLGLTLIELMIAMLVGLFLLAGIVMVFINSNRSNHMQENLARLQENGRFAIEFLTKDTRMVGYWDCMKPIAAPNNDDLKGTEGASGAPDSITIRGAFVRSRANGATCGVSVATAPFPATPACPQAAEPSNFYADNSSIITYSINNGNLRRVTNCTTNDVVEGIENLQILYGVDTADVDQTPNFYASATDVTATNNWFNVKSLRFSITVSTPDGGLTTKTADGRIRQTFTATIALRNRML
jgi:type IV pilus assembly protein PilW